MRLATLLLALSLTAAAQSPENVRVRAWLEPDSGIIVGQQVRLTVEVATTTWFPSAPQFPELDITNAISMMPESFGVGSRDYEDGVSWTGQQRSYVIYPQRVGRYRVPSVAVTLQYAQDDGKPSEPVTLSSPELQFEVNLPEAAVREGVASLVATPQLTVDESYDKGFKEIKVGDSVRRTVRMSAADSVGMLLPPIPFEGADGVSVYPDRPQISDRFERGNYSGNRTEAVTYVFGAEGRAFIPEVSFFWWDLSDSRLKEEVLPAVELTVAPNPDLEAAQIAQYVEEQAPAPSEEVDSPLSWKMMGMVVGILALLLLACRLSWKYILRLRRWLSEPGVRDLATEEQLFRVFRKASHSGESRATMRSLMFWLDSTESFPPAATLDAFAHTAEDRTVALQTEILQSGVYGPEGRKAGEWSGRLLYRAVAGARGRLRRRGNAANGVKSALPPLNPLDES